MPASDYESDAAHYMESRPPPAPQLLNRTNTDLNLSVLQRYLPSISSILSIAANAVVYTFAPATQDWEKPGVEGTLFVCNQDPSSPGGAPRVCVFVLNRRGLDNVILELTKVSHCELQDEFIVFTLDDPTTEQINAGEEGSEPKIIALWIHEDKDNTREINAALMIESWEHVREASQNEQEAAQNNGGFDPSGLSREESVGPAMQAMGRKLSLSDLFGRQS
jgi:hypothetical protein